MRSKIILLLISLFFLLGCQGSNENSDLNMTGASDIHDNAGAEPPQPAPTVEMSERPKSLGSTPIAKSTSEFGNDAFIETLEKAKMVFDPPYEMLIDKTETVKLVIDLNKTFEELEAEFRDTTNLSRRDILVSEKIEVKLTGSAFTIKSITPETQFLSKLETTEWKWDITANKIGEQNLNLVVTAISPNGKNRVRTFDEIIVVNNLSFLEQVINFFKSEYKWLFATFIIPLFLWYMKMRKSNQENQ